MRKNFKFYSTGNAFLLAFGLYYAASIVYELIMTFVFRRIGRPVATQWCAYLLNPIVFIGTMLIYSRRKRVDIVSAAKLNKKINGKQAGIIAALSIFCIMAFLPISQIFLDILGRLGFDMSLSIVNTSSSVGAYFLGLLLLAVLPALSEELLMRGVVLNAAEQKRDFSYAILITAGMFSLMHGNPIQTVHQFLLGMVLAYIVLVSRSLWAAVLLHFLNNFLSLTLDWPVNWFLNAIGLRYMPVYVTYIVGIVCIIFGGTMVVYLLKKFTKFSLDKKRFNDAEVIDVYPDGEKEAKRNDFKQAFADICGLFKKRGFKNAYDNVNTVIREIVPEEVIVEEPTREDFMPANIKLVYILLAIIWIISLITGFLI